jgi:hypothetical protein
MGNMMDVMRKNQERKDQEAADAERPTSSKNTGKYSKLPEGAELRGGAKDYVNKKSGPIVTAISAEPTTKMAPVSKPAEAVVAVKKSDSKSMAAPVKKSSPRETSGSRASRQAAYDAFKADQVDYNKGLANDRMGISADDTAELAALKPEDFKKGGMTKRPPKPAKKVPPRKFASGGTTRSSTSHRGDGCATKGHTKGRVR